MTKVITAISDNVEAIFAKDELAYQSVLDGFPTAAKVFVMTFNLSSRDAGLLKEIERVPPDCSVRLVTNIPSRFESYWGKGKDKAKTKIKAYLDLLKPKDTADAPEVYFLFANHAKVVATDALLYLGSANFSSESSANYECGVLISDPTVIEELLGNIWEAIRPALIPHPKGAIIARALVETVAVREVLEEFSRRARAVVGEGNNESPTWGPEEWTSVAEDILALREALDDLLSLAEDADPQSEAVQMVLGRVVDRAVIERLVSHTWDRWVLDFVEFDSDDYVDRWLAAKCSDEEDLADLQERGVELANEHHEALLVRAFGSLSAIQRDAITTVAALSNLSTGLKELIDNTQ